MAALAGQVQVQNDEIRPWRLAIDTLPAQEFHASGSIGHDVDPAGGTDAPKDLLGQIGIGRIVVHSEVITPEDLEVTFGMDGGHMHHGEHALDQMLVARPMLGMSNYGSPIPGLYLGSAGSHPGGGITGLPGLLAAGEVAAHLKTRRT